MQPWSQRFSAIGRKYSPCRLTFATAARVAENGTNNLGLIKPAWAEEWPDVIRRPEGAVSAIAVPGTHRSKETPPDRGREGSPLPQNHSFGYCTADRPQRRYGSRCF